jgi:hypothetical protein
MAAVRKALESAHVRKTVCFLEQELSERLSLDPVQGPALTGVLEDVQSLLSMAR